MERRKEDTIKRPTDGSTGFANRLAQIVAEFGSRYRLAKTTGIPVSTLQNYALGSQPGIAALTTLARVANVDLTWLMTGKGQMRGAGQFPGAALADVVMVDQYDPKSSLQIPVIVNQVPFSRHYLESVLRLGEPNEETLLVIESAWELLEVSRRDLLLIDRNQAQLALDGIYLLNLLGFSPRAVFNRPQGKLNIIEPLSDPRLNGADAGHPGRQRVPGSYQIDRSELLGGSPQASKVIGRVVWIGRAI